MTGKIYTTKFEKHLKNMSDFFVTVLIFFALLFAIFNATFTAAEVKGLSMYPTLNKQYNKVTDQYKDVVYYTEPYSLNYSDIVIVDLPDNSKDGIKRLIAMGGDIISFGDINIRNEYQIYLNNQALIEPYLNDIEINRTMINNFKDMIVECLGGDETKLQQEWLSLNDKNEWQITLPEDYCIYLGDNRGPSYDCSHFGPQKLSTIVGKVQIIVPYGFTIFNYWWYQFCQLFK